MAISQFLAIFADLAGGRIGPKRSKAEVQVQNRYSAASSINADPTVLEDLTEGTLIRTTAPPFPMGHTMSNSFENL